MIRKKKILFVDDEPLVSKLYARAVASISCDSQFCSDGEQALSLISKTPPDLIITDLNMPGLSGAEFVDTLKSQGRKSMPVIFLSASPGAEIVRLGLAGGGDDFLLKGMSFEVIIARVKFWTTTAFRALPEDARQEALTRLEENPPENDPILLLHSGRDLLIDRAFVALLDQLLAAPTGFGMKPAERERLLGVAAGSLSLLGRGDAVSAMRRADHLTAIVELLGGDWRHRLAAEMADFEAVSSRATYKHAAQNLQLIP